MGSAHTMCLLVIGSLGLGVAQVLGCMVGQGVEVQIQYFSLNTYHNLLCGALVVLYLFYDIVLL